MKKIKHCIVLILGYFLNFKAYSDNKYPTILKFPESLGYSIWHEPKYKRYNEGSSPYIFNTLYGSFGHSETTIVNLLGKPIKRSESELPNHHEPEHSIKYIQLLYDGLIIELSTTHKQRTFVNRTFISNCHLPSKFQFYLCSTVENLKEKLGKPSIESSSELTYLINIGDMGTVSLRIFVRDGFVIGIYTKNLIN